jgi:hypothetical protein
MAAERGGTEGKVVQSDRCGVSQRTRDAGLGRGAIMDQVRIGPGPFETHPGIIIIKEVDN